MRTNATIRSVATTAAAAAGRLGDQNAGLRALRSRGLIGGGLRTGGEPQDKSAYDKNAAARVHNDLSHPYNGTDEAIVI